MAKGWSRDRWVLWIEDNYISLPSTKYTVYRRNDGKVRVKYNSKFINEYLSIDEAVNSVLTLTNDPISVYITPGKYVLENPISINRSNVSIRGDGKSTILIKEHITKNAIEVVGGSNVDISGLAIDGNSTGTAYETNGYNGIYVANSNDIFIHGNEIYNNYSNGICINSTDGEQASRGLVTNNRIHDNYNGLSSQYLSDLIISENVLHNNNNIGIYIAEPSQRTIISMNEMSYNKTGMEIVANEIGILSNTLLYNSNKGIYLANYERNIVGNNIVTGSGNINIHVYNKTGVIVLGNYTPDCVNSNSYGILFEGVTKSQIISNLSTNVGGFKQAYGIYVDNSSYDNIVKNNIAWGNLTSDYYIADISSQSFVKNNYGLVTENSGSSTFSGDGTTTQFTISHGLVAEPTKVTVTPATADASGSFYVTKDATNIYVNYNTAPPAGTSNVVLTWEAKV